MLQNAADWPFTNVGSVSGFLIRDGACASKAFRTPRFDTKADASALLSSLGAPVAGVQLIPGGLPWFHLSRSARPNWGQKMS
jgi:hypothetical protein